MMVKILKLEKWDQLYIALLVSLPKPVIFGYKTLQYLLPHHMLICLLENRLIIMMIIVRKNSFLIQRFLTLWRAIEMAFVQFVRIIRV